jgi:putative membrane protein
MTILTQDDQKRIAAAIDMVDQKSDGEIYCLVAQSASHYPEVRFVWASLAALLLPPLALLFGITPDHLLHLSGSWTAQTLGERDILYALSAYVAAQSLLFAVVALLLSLPALRELATPGFVKAMRVKRMAAQHFTTSGMHLKETQPHVLIFLALAEKRVEIVAAPAIHAIVGNSVWEAARDAIVAGMRSDPTDSLCRAVDVIGAPLIQHFPATAAHPDINAHGVGEI